MKILTATEIKTASESEKTKDIVRLETTRKALSDAQKKLDEAEAKFDVALANQRIRWATEEEEAVKKLGLLLVEINALELRREQAIIPIDDEKKKAHDLFIQAETVLADARGTATEADKRQQHNQELSDILQTRLDGLSEREVKLDYREKNLAIREESAIAEREQIKKLSQELSIKLSHL